MINYYDINDTLSADEISNIEQSFVRQLNELETGIIILKPERSVFFPVLYKAIYKTRHSLCYFSLNEKQEQVIRSNFETIHHLSIEKDNFRVSTIYTDSSEKLNNVELLVSSGTSSTQKIIVWHKEDILFHVDRINNKFGVDGNVTEYIIMPLEHSFGIMRMRCALFRNSSIYISNHVLDMKLLSKLEQLESSIFVGGVVTGLEMFVNRYLKERLSKFDSVYMESGSMLMSQELLNALSQLIQTHRVKYFHHYGSTEITRTGFVDYNSLNKNQRRILQTEDQKFRTNDINELEIFNTNFFKGYLTASGFNEQQGSWFNTGDIVDVNDDFYCFKGRSVEVININGRKFMASTIERFISDKIGYDVMVFSDGLDKGIVAIIENDTISNELIKKLRKEVFKNFGCFPKLVFHKEFQRTISGKKIRIKSKYGLS